MGAHCTKRDQKFQNFTNYFTVNSSPIKIGNLIFIDYLQDNRDCSTLESLLTVLPDCFTTEILCYSLIKDLQLPDKSYVVIEGITPSLCENLSLLVEIHHN